MSGELLIDGMHGMGDNLHMRAGIRALFGQGPHPAMEQLRRVWLKSPWPSLFHDFDPEKLQVVRPRSRLRTQAKNEVREMRLFAKRSPPGGLRARRIFYSINDVMESSVLGAMMKSFGLPPANDYDFSIEVPMYWRDSEGGSPSISTLPSEYAVVRPLVERSEWGGCGTRNPDASAYNRVAELIEKELPTVCVGDLQPHQEWPASPLPARDYEFLKGELRVRQLMALIAGAKLVLSPPGFAIIAAQAVRVPYIVMFGGYQNAASLEAGANLPPHMSIEPIKTYMDFKHRTDCDKTIALDESAVSTFIESIV